jgi:hypothetical protein
MNIENAVRNLNDLSTLDDRLAEDDFPEEARRVELRDRRAALRDAMPEIVLRTYDALARNRRKPVVVAVRSAHCEGCHLRLPPQLDSAIRRRESLSVCPHCRRLLYPAPSPVELEPVNRPADAALPVRVRVSTAKSALRARVPSRPQSAARAAKRVSKTRPIQAIGTKRRSAKAVTLSALALELEVQSR